MVCPATVYPEFMLERTDLYSRRVNTLDAECRVFSIHGAVSVKVRHHGKVAPVVFGPNTSVSGVNLSFKKALLKLNLF